MQGVSKKLNAGLSDSRVSTFNPLITSCHLHVNVCLHAAQKGPSLRLLEKISNQYQSIWRDIYVRWIICRNMVLRKEQLAKYQLAT